MSSVTMQCSKVEPMPVEAPYSMQVLRSLARRLPWPASYH